MSRDPDIDQAVEDLRDMWAERRAARLQRDELDPTLNRKACAALDQQIGDLTSIIRTRAERIPIDARALMAILSVDRALNSAFRRKPSARQVARLLAERAEDTAVEEETAHKALTDAQERVRRATVRRLAAHTARDAYGSGRA